MALLSLIRGPASATCVVCFGAIPAGTLLVWALAKL